MNPCIMIIGREVRDTIEWIQGERCEPQKQNKRQRVSQQIQRSSKNVIGEQRTVLNVLNEVDVITSGPVRHGRGEELDKPSREKLTVGYDLFPSPLFCVVRYHSINGQKVFVQRLISSLWPVKNHLRHM